MQLCVVHVDHHAWHDRSQLPLQAHFALETRPLFRLIPYWTRLSLSFRQYEDYISGRGRAEHAHTPAWKQPCYRHCKKAL
jgi:hypothetical protein